MGLLNEVYLNSCFRSNGDIHDDSYQSLDEQVHTIEQGGNQSTQNLEEIHGRTSLKDIKRKVVDSLNDGQRKLCSNMDFFKNLRRKTWSQKKKDEKYRLSNHIIYCREDKNDKKFKAISSMNDIIMVPDVPNLPYSKSTPCLNDRGDSSGTIMFHSFADSKYISNVKPSICKKISDESEDDLKNKKSFPRTSFDESYRLMKKIRGTSVLSYSRLTSSMDGSGRVPDTIVFRSLSDIGNGIDGKPSISKDIPYKSGEFLKNRKSMFPRTSFHDSCCLMKKIRQVAHDRKCEY